MIRAAFSRLKPVRRIGLLLSFLILIQSMVRAQQADPPPAGAETAVKESDGAPSGTATQALDSQNRQECGSDTGIACALQEENDIAQWLQRSPSVGAVDGSGLVELGRDLRRKSWLELGTIGGYDSALLDQQGLSSGFFGGLGSVAQSFSSARSEFLLQDAFTAINYSGGGGALEVLNTFSGALNTRLNQTSTLEVNGLTSYGNDSLRAIAPAVQQPVGITSGVPPGDAVFGLHTGDVLTANAAVSLKHQSSELSSWSYSANNSYLRYFDDGLIQNTLTGEIDYERTASRSIAYGFYGIGVRQSGNISCVSGGGGASISFRPTRNLQVDGKAGPVLGNGNTCGHALQVISSASISLRATRQTTFFVSADHQPNNGTLPQAIWTTSISTGIQHAFNSRLQAGAGYAYTLGQANPQEYTAQYFGANIHLMLGRKFWEDASVRHYSRTGFEAVPGETVFVATLWWSPWSTGEKRQNRSGR